MSSVQQEPIAIVGTACRFPGGSNTPSKLWELLRSPRDLVKRVPTDRFDPDAYFHPNGSHHGTTDCRTAYFLDEDVTRFDNAFFNIQPAEAEAIDPQQRLLMETIYESLCAAGQPIEKLRGSNTAVYVGMMCDDWAQLSNRDWDLVHTYAATGHSRAIVSNRVSYYFDWHGPSMTIDTACSSSLVAVHQGVTALRNGETKIAVAAGANLILTPGMWIAESKLHMLSPTGTSKMWDAAADGYARGEGIAAIIMKPLSDAIRDGDHIDCIIRGTGVNQDGRTAGLTMPSNLAQAELIRDTYARAGLDINDPKDRPQFFHAHGTGTPAGDPQESEAISRAFFKDGKVTDTLYVGSIKTVIGHTEGTAGLASLIGTSLALQHRTIPPNLHFNNLSSSVAPFYNHLEIPTSAKPWPATVPGQPRRASINSFGFGGTNAHAILEAYEPETHKQEIAAVFSPLTFSAGSSSALRVMLSEFSDFLKVNPNADLRDVAHTLQARRSTLAFRKAITIKAVDEAIGRIDSLLSDTSGEDGLNSRYFDVAKPSILGVFTGQGAQWPRMGAQLIETSPFAADRIDALDRALSSLPVADRPDWTLRDQLLAGSSTSRLAEAAIAQPLCTAVQIVLVDLLKEANIKLRAVVGHSSGEIAAAYAAGFLSAKDAIRVAYYRGIVAKLARSPNGAKGAMMAVGTSFEDAVEFCQLDEFEGRIRVAARNSASSITLSGDEDAIDEAFSIFKDEGNFARKLRVDTAYHSGHMLPCASPYIEAMTRSNITTGDGNDVTWYSSVVEGQVMSKETLRPQYWVDNMTRAVLFSPAVSAAVADAGPFDLAIEFGPHPALKGPCLDTIEEVAGQRPPYTGVLSRNKSDAEELSTALGFVWTQLGAGTVDFDRFEKAVSGVSAAKGLITDLPKYPFDHPRSFYALSRVSGGHKNVHTPPHPILGRLCVESETVDDVSWRNILRPSENAWLQGHQLQGQTVYPATGFIALAVEAAVSVAGNKPIGLINIENVTLGRAIAFGDDSIGLESKVTLKTVYSTDTELRAEFACYSGLPFDNAAPLALNCSATVSVTFHEPAPDTLPNVQIEEVNLVDAEPERFYRQFSQLGYNYSPPFRGVRTINRKMGYATGDLEDESGDDWEDQLIVHPGWLDSAIQTGFAAYCHPQDMRLWALHVPTVIRSVLINPYFTKLGLGRERHLKYQAAAHENPILLDVDVFAGDGGSHTFIQFESVKLAPFSAPTPQEDAVMFSHFVHKFAGPDARAAVTDEEVMSPERAEILLTAERAGFFYLRRVHETITPEEKANTLEHYQHLLNFAARVVDIVSRGEHPNVPREALVDSHQFIRSMIMKHHNRADLRLLEAVGENLVDEIRRNGSMLEHMMKDGMLDRFYEEATSLDLANGWIGRIIAQIAHRYPHMHILEVGAGTGGSTKCILPELKSAFSTYTYTDISAGFFDRAQERFKEFSDRLVFKTFNMEKPPVDQGYTEGTYDIVLASNVLHATGKLEDMMSNVRQLLKPGGYLVALEIISNDFLGMNCTMGGLPGWWGGAANDPSRRNGPCLTVKQWDALTRRHGFAGVETATPLDHKLQLYCVLAFQAVDDRVNSLRAPLEYPAPIITPNLVIVGGKSPAVRKLVSEASGLLHSRYAKVTRLESLEDLNTQGLVEGSSVLSLTELDEQYFKTRTASKLEALRSLWRNGHSILWVTRGARDDNPHSAMLLGAARVVRFEYPNINLQILDFDDATVPTSKTLVEKLISLEISNQWTKEGADILWSVEPELHYDNNKLLIPRLYPYTRANNRYNTYRRLVHDVVNPRESTVALESTKTSYELVEVSPLRVVPPVADSSTVDVLVLQTLLQIIRVNDAGFFVLCTGTDAATGESLIALSDKAESRVVVPTEHVVRVPSSVPVKSLVSVAAYILAKSIVTAAPKFGTILVHEADGNLIDAITKEAAQEGVQVAFTSSTKAGSTPRASYVHRNLPARLIEKLLPRDISFFVNLGQSPGAAEVGDLLARYVPSHVRTTSQSEFVRTEAIVFPDDSSEGISQVIKGAWQTISRVTTKRRGASQEHTPVVALQDVGSHSVVDEPLSIVDWNAASVQVATRPIDHGDIFRGDGTYFLIGLSGELGQSLCQWMVQHGARYVVLSSRRPKVDPQYIETLEDLGATIKVIPLDITSRDSLRACYDEICRDMPPVIGVANGAMILEDIMFDDLTFESFDRSASPKIDGSKLLDELFYDTKLDFFILFTSVANIVGNTGQSSYVMANQFMAALAAQRRKRGVVGSDISISSVQGIGYTERSERFDSDHFTKMGYRNMSEQDYLQLFAEAILVGQPDSTESSEIATGLAPFYDDPSIQAQIRTDPKFRRFILERADTKQASGKTAAVALRIRLPEVKTLFEAEAIIKEAFIDRLKRILMIPQDESINEMVTLVEQGADSIMAVEVRTWFLKELDVDMPVLKIMGASSTIAELLSEAIQKLPPTILDISKLGTDSSATSAPVTKSALESQQGVRTKGAAVHSTPSTIPPTETASSGSPVLSTPATPPEEDEPRKAADSHELRVPDWRKVVVDSSTEQTEQMSFGQASFWFLSHYVKDPNTFNIAYMAKLTGPLRIADMERAVEMVGQRHEALRTRFFWSDDDNRTPTQGVLSKSLVRLEKRRIASDAEALKALDDMWNHEWDLGYWIPVRICLLSLSDSAHYFLIGTHHISLDGYSFNVLMLDLHAAYLGHALHPVPETSQARAFGVQQRNAYQGGQMQKAINYYRAIAPQELRPIQLFSFAKVQVRSPLDHYSNNVARLRIDSQLSSKLKQLARRHRSTAFHLYLAALQALIFRLLPDTNEFFLGVTDANRLDKSFMNSIGDFLNLLPLRFDRARPGTRFSEAIQTARTKAYAAMEHSNVPFDVLLDELNVLRSNSYSPIFQILVDYRLMVQKRTEWSGCRLTDERWIAARSGYDVALEIIENPTGETDLVLRSQEALYSLDSTELLLRSYIHLLKEVGKGIDFAVDALPKWDPVDIEKAMIAGRGPDLRLEWPATVSHRIDEVIRENPDHIALKDGYGRSLTYQDLDERVESIARALRASGAQEAAVVGVFQKPSSDWICSLLAIHRVGAVYVPLDLHSSIPRLRTTVAAARPAIILTDKETKTQIPEIRAGDTVTIDISGLPTSVKDGAEKSLAREKLPAYIIFTSGSTGEPKGSVITHSNLRAQVEGFHRTWNIAAVAGNVLQQAAFSFDISLLQIYAALTTGGCLYIVPDEARGDPHEVTRIMFEQNITFTHATPTEYDMWFRFAPDNLRKCTAWKTAWFGGELPTSGLLSGFRKLGLPGLRTFNSYGPTECTISVFKGEVDYLDESLRGLLPGRLLPNFSAYVVDEQLAPVPIGVPGEILLGGAGVCDGYLGPPDLTAQQFLPNKFIKNHAHYMANGWDRAYRSGDYGRVLSDGMLSCEGRIAGDTQVKLRGFRIELGEIERVMIKEAAGALAHAIVTLRDDSFLVAHVVFTPGTVDEVRHKILHDFGPRLPLPPYMRPAHVVPLDAIPLTSHAKTDRKAIQNLPLPDEPSLGSEGDGVPRRELTHAERILASLWADVIPHCPASLAQSSNFFRAGGNSLLLVKLQSLIKRAFGTAPRLGGLMNANNLEQMAGLLGATANTGAINWDDEIALDSDLLQAARHALAEKPTRTADGRLRVLVTGATGVLGQRALQYFVGDDRVAKVVCLVRQVDGRDLTRLFSNLGPKVSVVESDVEESNLGLNEAHFASLSRETDAILHCAANRSFWDGYEVVRPANVNSVKALARLAVANDAHLHVLSSGAVALYEPDPDLDETDGSTRVYRPRPPVDGATDGYVASKWAAERYLARAAREVGLRVTAHRPSATPSSAAGTNGSHKNMSNGAEVEAIARDLLDVAGQLGARPDFGRISGTMDLAPLEAVAAAVTEAVIGQKNVDEIVGREGSDKERMHIFVHPGTVQALTTDLDGHAHKLLQEAEGARNLSNLPVLPALKWVGQAKKAGLFKYLITAQDLAMFDEEDRRLVSRR